jgi:Tfp pilus assembly protein PilF
VEAHSRNPIYRVWRFVTRRKVKFVAALGVAVLAASGVIALERQAEKSRRNEAGAWCIVGKASIRSNDDMAALVAFTRAIEAHPAAQTYLERSYAYWRLCDYGAAATDLRTARAMDPSIPGIDVCLASIAAAGKHR